MQSLSQVSEDRAWLIDAAFERLTELRARGLDLTNMVLAKAKQDVFGRPWDALVYSADSHGADLRLVGHRDYTAHAAVLQRATRLSKANAMLGRLRMPEGLKIDLPASERLRAASPRSPRGENLIARTDACLETDVLRRIGAPIQSDQRFKAKAVGLALTSFEGAMSPQPLRAVSLEEIGEAFRARSGGCIAVSIVEGVDAFRFGTGRLDYVEDSMMQVASQFNFLESTSPNYMPLQDYADDRTQGPQASLGCPGMLVHRNGVFKEVPAQPFFEVFPRAVYEGGYFMPSMIRRQDLEAAAAHFAANSGELRVLAQSGKTLFGTETIQVFTAAPSFQGQPRPDIGSTQGHLCEVIVSLQYQALGRLAALRTSAIGRPVRLHVTLVGQGAFNNPPEVMATSFRLLLHALAGYDVAVYVHAWSTDDVARARAALRAAQFAGDIRTVSAADFYR